MNGIKLQFRRMTLQDIEQVMQVEREVYQFPWTEQIFSDCIRVGYQCWLGLSQQQIIGHAVISVVADESHMLNLSIARAHQRKGYGLQFVHFLVETHRPIDLVIVMLGTNDLKATFGVSAYDIGKATSRLLRCIAGSTSGPDQAAPTVLLVSPVPITETGWLAEMFRGGRAKSLELASYLRGVAGKNGLAFVDAAQLAEIDPVDGIHLSAEAHRSIGLALAEKIRSGEVI